MPPSPKHSRRRFRFSTRTLFVLVTLLAVSAAWFAGEMQLVTARKEFLRLHLAEGSQFITAANIEELNEYARKLGKTPDWPSPMRLPIWRRWLGDEGIVMLSLPDRLCGCRSSPGPYPDVMEHENRRNELFPEAADFIAKRSATRATK